MARSFCNPLIEEHRREFKSSGERLIRANEEAMWRQN